MKNQIVICMTVILFVGCAKSPYNPLKHYNLQNIQEDASKKSDQICVSTCKSNFLNDYGEYRNSILGNSLSVMKKYRECVDRCDVIKTQYIIDDYTNDFNENGISKATGTKYDKYGFDVRGFNIEGIHCDTGMNYNLDGFNAHGVHKDTGTPYDNDGYNYLGYNENGFNKEGYNLTGYDSMYQLHPKLPQDTDLQKEKCIDADKDWSIDWNNYTVLCK